jgi:hypothetical protein
MPAKSSDTATILKAGLLAGTLDIIAAIVVALIKGYSPIVIFRYIASAVFGRVTAGTGWGMVAVGLLFHFLIAVVWAAIFYAIYPVVQRFIKSPIVAGLLYGIFVWIVMNLVVVPISRVKQGPFTTSGVIREMAILMICIGLPIALITGNSYRRTADK